MSEKELLELLTNALQKTKTIKHYKKYQNDKGVQIMTKDGTLFNILPVSVTDKGCCIIPNK